MTLRELVQWTGDHSLALAILLGVPPLLTWVLDPLHGRGHGGQSPWKYIYSLLVYVACIPGIFAGVLTGYSLFFRNENLLDVNVFVYLLPIVSMTLTLLVVSRNVSFDEIPGFDRLSGLMISIAISFAFALALQRTRIWLLFGGSIQTLLVLAAGLFALLKWGTHLLFRRRDEPKPESPRF